MSTTHQRKTADTLPGTSAALVNEQAHCASAGRMTQEEQIQQLRAIGERMTHFQRLEKGFAARGWGLYPLSDDSLLASAWGMSRVLPDLHAAQRLLRMIGGAA